jgi:twitching motility protein PilU
MSTSTNTNPLLTWLQRMTQQGASDLFLTTGFPAAFKINGRVTPISDQPLTAQETNALAHSVMNDKQWAGYTETNEANFAIHYKDLGRFRVSVFRQQGQTGVVFRTINTQIPKLEDLSVPMTLKDIAMIPRGLVLMVGGTGTGKSTSLAAMMGYRNGERQDHILTVEDPIEFVHTHRKSIITQREVGTDTDSWEVGLKNSLRQAPDVILIGEIRERAIMQFALQYAETGHLCLSTLHANNSNQALERILSFFPLEKRNQLLLDLSMNLKAIVSQRLIPKADGSGRVPAVEIMMASPLISDMIGKGQFDSIREIMAKSRDFGMQTFDQSLFDLYKQGLITQEDALRNADSYNDLRLKIMLSSGDAADTLRTPTDLKLS